ncbi:MAG: hypothetical protein JWQ97_1865 [Phenylobacterium sp.]|nr:hypothetical protein [Phenylobacterium sp.]
MMRLGLSERYAHFRHQPHPMLSFAAEGAAEILLGIGLLIALALAAAVLWAALTAVGVVRGW